jgi:hypothetical protein
MTSSSDEREHRLDAALASLPREIAPARDLWGGVEQRLDPVVPRRRSPLMWQLAAAVVLVVGSSLITATLVRREAPVKTRQPVPASEVTSAAVPVTFAGDPRLDPGYLEARRLLAKELEARINRMPASARAKLEANLAEIRRATEEINAALAQQPNDPLLQELLLNTYQDELAVMASVNQLTTQNGNGVPGQEPRLQL